MTGAVPEPAGASPAWPARDPRGHKGTFGTVAVVGGCAEGHTRMIGAPAFAAAGALRAGAGRVRLVAPEPIIHTAIGLVPSAVGVAIPTQAEGVIQPHVMAEVLDHAMNGCEALVVGPGMGQSAATSAAALRAVTQDAVAVVLDADAITALAATPELLRDFRAPAVLTPHPGEFRRLALALNVPVSAAPATGDRAAREAVAAEVARRLAAVIVLKGAETVVTDGHRAWCCPAVNPVLATAGTGDVLAGVIAGIMAQFLGFQEHRPPPMPPKPRPPGRPLDLFDCARLGVAAHARAADLWRQASSASGGMLAMELADLLPAAIAQG